MHVRIITKFNLYRKFNLYEPKNNMKLKLQELPILSAHMKLTVMAVLIIFPLMLLTVSLAVHTQTQPDADQRCADPEILGLHPWLHLQGSIRIHKTKPSGIRYRIHTTSNSANVNNRLGSMASHIQCVMSKKLQMQVEVCTIIITRE